MSFEDNAGTVHSVTDLRLAAEAAPAVQYWTGPLVVEGVPTGDKRRVMPDALTWRDLPQPLMFQRQTPEGRGNPHAGASLAGRITTIWREGDTIHGAGTIDTGADGADLARFMADGPIGVSVDMDDVDAEMSCLEEDELGECSSAEMQIVKARVMGATACAFPAIPEASISTCSAEEYAALITAHEPTMALATQVEEHDFEDSGDGTCTICGGTQEEHNALMAEMAMVASGGPLLPPETWFEDPGLTAWTPLQISDDGRVFGHMARWGQKHTGQQNRTPPKSATGYAYFKVGSRLATCECPDRGGKVEVATGTITLGTHHDYDFNHSVSEVIGHYDHTGYAVADVNAGEDAIGIWVAGALRPDVSEERIIELRGGGLSGDWRFIGGRLEMVAALVVNQPGFPVPKTTWHEREGKVTALVAAGVAVGQPWAPTQEWVLANQAQTEALETRLGLAEARLTRHAQDLAALRPLILAGLGERLHLDALATKDEEGKNYPAGDYAYVPDATKPSTWKLRLTATPGGKPDPAIVGAAAAALSPGGFRGNRVSIPAADKAKVVAKVRAAWRTANPEKDASDMPASIRG